MDIIKISSANKNDKVILSDRRECIIKQKLEKHTLENGNIIWKIFMKDDKYFIIDDISLNDVLLHPNIWFISNSKYIVSRNEGKTINLNQLLLPKNNEKELYSHKDGDNFNFRISNILLTTQSIVNSKKTNKINTKDDNIKDANIKDIEINKIINQDILENKEGNNNSINIGDNNASINKPIKQYKLYDELQYRIIDKKDNYIILENKDEPNDKIIEMIAKNDGTTKFIFDFTMLDNVLKLFWLYHSGTGYICNNTTKHNSTIDRSNMLYFHSFIYFTAYPDLEKKQGYSIHHKNLNKLDNRISNLDYVNQSIQNAIRDNPKRITKQPAIQDIKEDIPKLATYYPAKGDFGEYFEVDVKSMKNDNIQFERIRKKTTKSKECTLIDKVCHSIVLRYQIIHNLLTTNTKISLSRFCLEGKQFTGLIEFKKYHEQSINNILNKYADNNFDNDGDNDGDNDVGIEAIQNNYTITSFEKYIKEKSKKKANSGSFKPKQNQPEQTIQIEQ